MVKNVNMETYDSPQVKVLAVESEGVLCSSVINSHEGFTFYDDEEIL